MSALTPFRQTGPTVTLPTLAAAPATQAVQAPSTGELGVGNQQYVLTNTGTKSCFLAVAQNQPAALQNAGAPIVGTPQNIYVLLAGSQVTITGPVNAWFAGVCQGSDTTTVWVTPGYGQ